MRSNVAQSAWVTAQPKIWMQVVLPLVVTPLVLLLRAVLTLVSPVAPLKIASAIP
jgi:hypothetical protein